MAGARGAVRCRLSCAHRLLQPPWLGSCRAPRGPCGTFSLDHARAEFALRGCGARVQASPRRAESSRAFPSCPLNADSTRCANSYQAVLEPEHQLGSTDHYQVLKITAVHRIMDSEIHARANLVFSRQFGAHDMILAVSRGTGAPSPCAERRRSHRPQPPRLPLRAVHIS